MSRTTAGVSTWSYSGPVRARQSAVSRRLYATTASYCDRLVISGAGAARTSAREQTTGWLPPTPRGSKPTMSNTDRRPALMNVPSAKSTPDSPGPPGFTTRVPIRCAGSVAGRRATATPMRPDAGSVQSIGTDSVPHWAVRSPGQGVQAIPPAAPVAAGGPAADETAKRTAAVTHRVVARTARSSGTSRS
jgi:hypothetical protein